MVSSYLLKQEKVQAMTLRLTKDSSAVQGRQSDHVQDHAVLVCSVDMRTGFVSTFWGRPEIMFTFH